MTINAVLCLYIIWTHLTLLPDDQKSPFCYNMRSQLSSRANCFLCSTKTSITLCGLNFLTPSLLSLVTRTARPQYNEPKLTTQTFTFNYFRSILQRVHSEHISVSIDAFIGLQLISHHRNDTSLYRLNLQASLSLRFIFRNHRQNQPLTPPKQTTFLRNPLWHYGCRNNAPLTTNQVSIRASCAFSSMFLCAELLLTGANYNHCPSLSQLPFVLSLKQFPCRPLMICYS